MSEQQPVNGQKLKSTYYQALKAAGVEFSKQYRQYSVDELKAGYDKLVHAQNQQLKNQSPVEALKRTQALLGQARRQSEAVGAPLQPPVRQAPTAPSAPVARRDPNEMAGARQNTKDADVPLRIDPETGFAWFQEEVLKPAYPKPRGRRVLKYKETGTKVEEIKEGDYTETFEVAGDEIGRMAEVKITLPSYQVGIYKDKRFPFKIITYNGNQGFAFEDVQKFYGGSELVPDEVKRKYVENVLCYDIRSTIRAIQTEHRHLQLTNRI